MCKSNLPGVLHKSPYQFLLAMAVLAIILSSQVQPASSLIIFEVKVEYLTLPRNIDVASDGSVWFTAFGTLKGVGSYSETSNGFTIYQRSQPNTDPYGITLLDTDPWFTDQGTESIVRIVGTTFVDYNLAASADPRGITGGTVDGKKRIYFTESGLDRIGELDVDTGNIREWQLAPNTDPESIFFESQRRIWFTELSGNKIGKLDAISGTITEYSLPANTNPWGIAVDSLGNVWFAETGAAFPRKLGRLSFPGGFAELKEFSIPAGLTPREVTVDSLDNVWFTSFDFSQVGKYDRGSGLIQTFPTTTQPSKPWGIAAGPNDKIWFTESDPSANKIARITFSAHFTTSTATTIPRATTTTTVASSTPFTVTISVGATSAATAAATISTSATSSLFTTRSETILVVATVISGVSTFFTATTTVTGATPTTITQTVTSSVGTTITADTATVTVTSTTTHTSTSISTTITGTTLVGTVVVNPPIPGFPIESILAGLVFGLIALLLVRRRRTARPS